jgi:hypothetical protein
MQLLLVYQLIMLAVVVAVELHLHQVVSQAVLVVAVLAVQQQQIHLVCLA